MPRKAVLLSVLVVFLITLTGCANFRSCKNKDLEIQGLRNQISALEAQVQSRDTEINSLREASVKIEAEQKTETARKITKKKVIAEAKYRPNVKQIQIALKNAGYNPGPIDGRKGRQTKEAVKAFQKDNNLKESGRVDKQTWDLLKEYLYKKVK
ncbi:MAG: peptidoglycan-binding domain-containing protein [Candidatus Omnitrophica bacterium]|jgi:hypothetical protein|nr:peptidoglycan-binding domain-containing protein [Candidatus Omnitrophota bacterium]